MVSCRVARGREDTTMVRIWLLCGAVLALPGAVIVAAESGAMPVPTSSVFDLMQTAIVPASDTLWGIENPQTDAEWQVFVDAAQILVDAGQSLRAGGT